MRLVACVAAGIGVAVALSASPPKASGDPEALEMLCARFKASGAAIFMDGLELAAKGKRPVAADDLATFRALTFVKKTVCR